MKNQPRVAWVSPLPPDPTGVADYAADVLASLEDSFEITVVHPTPAALGPRGRAALTPAEWIARDAADPWDLALYQMGNHALHEWVWWLSRRRPGLVVAHDAAYLDLFYAIHAARGDREGFLDALLGEHGAAGFAHAQRVLEGAEARTLSGAWGAGGGWFSRLLDRLAGRRPPSVAPAPITLPPSLLATAIGDPLRVIVHNRAALRELERAVAAPVAVVPHYFDPGDGYLPRGSISPEVAGLPSGLPLILSLGFLNPNKRIERVLRALGAVARDGADFRFVIAGEIPDSLAPGVEAAIRDAGLVQRVIRTGYVPPARMRALLATCDFAINLRYPGGGESSGSLIRMLGAGMPVIVTDHGSAAEFPDDTVCKIPRDEREHDALTAAVRRLLADPEAARALGERAAAHIRAQHGLARVRDLYAAEMERALADRARPGVEAARRLWRGAAGNDRIATLAEARLREWWP